jgi:heme-degrading monooxygenase HmoA
VTHVRVWRFEPAAGREQEFAAAYAGDGIWSQLFRRADGFVETRLLAPAEPGGPWLTLDRWQSRSAFERFEQTHREAYRALDAELLHLTTAEQFIGAFEED